MPFFAAATFDVSSGIAGRCVNPAFVHAIAIPEVDMLDKLDKICAVARGDGAIDVINIETEMAATKKEKATKTYPTLTTTVTVSWSILSLSFFLFCSAMPMFSVAS